MECGSEVEEWWRGVVEWSGGVEWWSGVVEWNGGVEWFSCNA